MESIVDVGRCNECEYLTQIIVCEKIVDIRGGKRRGGATLSLIIFSLQWTVVMSWLTSLLPQPIPDEYGGATLMSLVEAVILCPLFTIAFILFALCLRVLIYSLIYRHCPGKGKEYDLEGKNYVITGGTSGIGKQVVRDVFSRHGSVILLVRDLDAGFAVVRDMRSTYIHSKGDISAAYCDLSNLLSVRKAADLIMKGCDRIDGLVCNAGIGAMAEYKKTRDGYESVIQVNCIAHALLMNILSCGLQLTNGVVVNVSSHVCHDTIPFDYEKPFFDEGNYDGYQAYCRSKLMVNAYTMLAGRTMKPDVCFLAVYPGIVFTKIGEQFVKARSRYPALLPYILPITRVVFWLVGRTVEQGSLTVWPILVDPDLRPPTGSIIDTRFTITQGDRLNKLDMSKSMREKMVAALNKAVNEAIDKWVDWDKNRSNPDISPDEYGEEDTLEEEIENETEETLNNVLKRNFSITRRLSKKRAAIVQHFKALKGRMRRESSTECKDDDAKTTKEESKGKSPKIVLPDKLDDSDPRDNGKAQKESKNRRVSVDIIAEDEEKYMEKEQIDWDQPHCSKDTRFQHTSTENTDAVPAPRLRKGSKFLMGSEEALDNCDEKK